MPSPSPVKNRASDRSLLEERGMLKPNAYGLPHTEAKQPSPIALSEAQMLALLAASYPLPPACAVPSSKPARVRLRTCPNSATACCIVRSYGCKSCTLTRPISTAACRASASGIALVVERMEKAK